MSKNRPSQKARRKLQTVADMLLEANNSICYLCQCKISHGESYNKDHVFPESQGYGFHKNMMPTHPACNLEKADRFPTLEEIERACIAYERAGLIFDPSLANIKVKKLFKPFEYYTNSLKKAA